jgi:uncharacterized membrane protein
VSPRAWDRVRAALSLAGLGMSAYLTLLHYDSNVPLACAAGTFVDCATVLASPSSVVMGVPVAVWGLLWFVVATVLAILFLRCPPDAKPGALRAAALSWALVGTATVLWLVFQEIGVVGKLCAWCTAVHAVVLALLVVEVQSPTATRSSRQSS